MGADAEARVDLYAAIHKALRAMMCDTMLFLGRLDPLDEREVVSCGQKVFDLLESCLAHLQHENTFVHPAMQARAPGSAALAQAEHLEHEQQIGRLSHLAGAMVKAPAARRASFVTALYRAMALFLSDNLQHMAHEETHHNSVLWAHYSDAELHEIEQRLVASISPQDMHAVLRWMVPACNPQQRAGIMSGMRAKAPPAAFDEVLDVVRPQLDSTAWGKLSRMLGLDKLSDRVAAMG